MNDFKVLLKEGYVGKVAADYYDKLFAQYVTASDLDQALSEVVKCFRFSTVSITPPQFKQNRSLFSV